MCELLGVSSVEKLPCNVLLREFYSHGTEHPDGWGLATFYENAVSLEKEPVSAVGSAYLRTRLTDDIVEDILLAHIRKASVGTLAYRNTHPFTRRDDSERMWTLIHNGTIFESAVLEPYKLQQRGESDSERILCYLVGQINAGRAISAQDRFSVVDKVIHAITPGNKVNLLIYDGELLYVHMNHRRSLYLWDRPGALVVSTQPLNQENWREVPLNTLLAYRQGELIYVGRSHPNEYIKTEDKENERP